MTKRLVPVAAILCDDIRHEASGAVSIMGVHTTEFMEEFPTSKRLSIVLIANSSMAGEHSFTTTFFWNDQKKWSAKHEVAILAKASGIVLPIEGPFAPLTEAGDLRLEVDFGAAKPFIQRWAVLNQDAEGTES